LQLCVRLTQRLSKRRRGTFTDLTARVKMPIAEAFGNPQAPFANHGGSLSSSWRQWRAGADGDLH